MRHALLAACVLAAACRLDIDTPAEPIDCVMSTRPVCMEADSYQDFGNITDKILNRNCTGSSCHEETSSSQKAKRLVFDQGPFAAYKTMVVNPDDPKTNPAGQVLSDIETHDDIPLVDPGHPERSYLYFAMHAIAPKDFAFHVASAPAQVGFMPYGNNTLCCQKLAAIQRWIENDAMPAEPDAP